MNLKLNRSEFVGSISFKDSSIFIDKKGWLAEKVNELLNEKKTKDFGIVKYKSGIDEKDGEFTIRIYFNDTNYIFILIGKDSIGYSGRSISLSPAFDLLIPDIFYSLLTLLERTEISWIATKVQAELPVTSNLLQKFKERCFLGSGFTAFHLDDKPLEGLGYAVTYFERQLRRELRLKADTEKLFVSLDTMQLINGEVKTTQEFFINYHRVDIFRHFFEIILEGGLVKLLELSIE